MQDVVQRPGLASQAQYKLEPAPNARHHGPHDVGAFVRFQYVPGQAADRQHTEDQK
jgi:hypothetical protein